MCFLGGKINKEYKNEKKKHVKKGKKIHLTTNSQFDEPIRYSAKLLFQNQEIVISNHLSTKTLESPLNFSSISRLIPYSSDPFPPKFENLALIFAAKSSDFG